jgi:hypothetical protein
MKTPNLMIIFLIFLLSDIKSVILPLISLEDIFFTLSKNIFDVYSNDKI